MRPVFLAHAHWHVGEADKWRNDIRFTEYVPLMSAYSVTWQGSMVTSWAIHGGALLSATHLPIPESSTRRFRPLKRALRPKDRSTMGQGSLGSRAVSSRMVRGVCSNWVGHGPKYLSGMAICNSTAHGNMNLQVGLTKVDAWVADTLHASPRSIFASGASHAT